MFFRFDLSVLPSALSPQTFSQWTVQNDGDEDDEDREQDRLAKHFAKRARRNRILEEYEGDSQFSRSRLIDEDVTMQQDLKTMKVSAS